MKHTADLKTDTYKGWKLQVEHVRLNELQIYETLYDYIDEEHSLIIHNFIHDLFSINLLPQKGDIIILFDRWEVVERTFETDDEDKIIRITLL